MEKYIKDVFKDFENVSNYEIGNAQIENINLYKKTNRLQVDLNSSSQITISELGQFENYLQDRFSVEKVLTNINYNNLEIEPKVKEDWKNIVSYITAKEPFSKAILTNSDVEITDNKLEVGLKIKGSDFLCSKKFDKGLEHLLDNLYNFKFDVSIKDNLEEGYFENLEKTLEQEEKRAVEKAKQEALENIHRAQVASQDAEIEAAMAAEAAAIAEAGNGGFVPSLSFKPKASGDDGKRELPPGMIYGRSPKIKGTPIKVIDITPDTENVVIDGECIRVDSNEMRSKPDKVILIFDLYDGTSTITCKAFIEKTKLKEISGRID